MSTGSPGTKTSVVGCGLFATVLLLAGGPAHADLADPQAPAKSVGPGGTTQQVAPPAGSEPDRAAATVSACSTADRVASADPMLAAAGMPMAGEKDTAEEAPRRPRLLISGFAMLDAIGDFQRMDPDWIGAFRPSKIPINSMLHDGEVAFSVRQSRLSFQGIAPSSVGDIKARFEFDLFGTGVDAGQTTMRVRHVYGEWGRFLAGQTNSVFMDIDVFPNVIDYWGPAGVLFFRNVQLRYTPITKGGKSVVVSIEAPGSAVDPGNAAEVDPALAGVKGRNWLPDFAAHYRQEGSFGHFQVSGILRNLAFETPGGKNAEPSGEKTGGGLSAAAVIKAFKKDKVYLEGTYGRGIAGYFNDGGVDLAPNGDLRAETVPSLGFQAYYEHPWGPKWTSSIGYSEHIQDNTGGQTGSAFHRGKYFSVNLLYSPVPFLLMGAEYLWGQRETNDGSHGDDNRLQFSFKYNFSN